MKIANLIKDARKKAGLTQKELGLRIGTSESMISQYENGHRRPKYSTLERIAEALGIEVDYLWVDAVNDPDRTSLILDDFCGASSELIVKLRAVGWAEMTCEDCSFMLTDGVGKSFPVTEEELKQLDEETDSFMLYKIQELMKKKTGDV